MTSSAPLRLCDRLFDALFSIAIFALVAQNALATERPNIVLIYADDLGYGDVGCYGATAVKTPHIDRIAREGLRFTDAHSAAATCTPSRYAMLTGQYAWRKEGTGILPGDAALIIEPGRTSLASMLQSAGYRTGVVGKWHLGLTQGRPDWNAEIKPGPREIGFEYSFIIPATGDRTPCVFIENGRVVGLDPADPIQVDYHGKVGNDPTGRENPDLLKMGLSHGHNFTIVNGISRIGYMSGGKSARWVDEEIADTITGKAVDFIRQNREKPFFLYFATHDIHVPRAPHARFRGATVMGPRGDAIAEFDWSVGQVLGALEKNGLTDNTLVIVTSDNGPVLDDGYKDDAVEKLGDHKPAGPLRGGKSTAFEGGTRVPFVLRWPNRVKCGKSDALISQIDLLASFAQLNDQKLSENATPDGFDVLPALLGESKQGRRHLVEQGRAMGIRLDNWKLILPAPGHGKNAYAGAENDGQARAQLYNLSKDLGETKNLAAKRPKKVEGMTTLFDRIYDMPRSRDIMIE